MMERLGNPFQSIVESVVEGVILVRQDGKIIMANPAAEKLFGYDPGSLIQTTIEALIPKSKRAGHQHLRTKYNENPIPRKMGIGRDLEGLRKDGTTFPIEVSLSNTIIDNSPVVIAFLIDISGRKSIEEELREERKTAKLYLEIAGAILMVLDYKGTIKMINQKGCQLLEDSEENILETNWFREFIPSNKRVKMKKIFNLFLTDQNRKTSFEYIILTKNGEEKIVEWDFVLLPGESIDGTTLLCSGVDITERKNIENALKKSEEKLITYAAELEKMVSNRTKQLADAIKKLEIVNLDLQEEIKERKKAEKDAQVAFEKEKEITEMKSRFVSLASHEFRTPLSTILTSVTLIDRYQTDDTLEKRNKHIHRIKNNVHGLTTLLNDFLNLERLEEGRFKTKCEVFDLVLFIQEIHDETQAITKSRQHIILSQSEEYFEVYLDKQMLKNICYNLISNAIKYSNPEQNIEFHCSIKNEDINIQVKDYGVGIPKSEQSHLFRRFFRANNVSGIQGTGLGLYIVKKYVEEMQGKISFTSEYQKGSTFTVQLPVRYDESIIN